MTHARYSDHDTRFGSARFADATDIQRAGLFGSKGQPIGFFDDRRLRLDADVPRITIAGSGAGKLITGLAYQLCLPNSIPMLILDPKGELSAISQHTLAPQNTFGYYWNPARLCGLPQHRLNPFSHIIPSSRHFHGDTAVAIESIIPFSGGGNAQYFEQRAREYGGCFMKHLGERDGSVSFPSFYDLVNTVEGDPGRWADALEAMFQSQFDDVRRCANEMLVKQQDAPKEFGAIIGTLYAAISFLHDPALRDSLKDGEADLSDLVGNSRKVRIQLNVPSEYLGLWSPVVRAMFSTTMALKARQPHAQPILLMVDEAGQLGPFPALKRAFTFGRGAGLIAQAIFQDTGQITRNFGNSGIQTFLGSSGCQQFYGVRDYETARLVSNSLGQQTLAYADHGRQQDATHRSHQQLTAYLNGADPIEVAQEYAHYEQASERTSYMQRSLMSPDEVLNMGADEQIIFLPGMNTPPIKAQRKRYFELREMAGLYLPNPYHPPTNSVRVKTRFGTKTLAVRRVPVPAKYRQFPQYKDGTALQIDGHPL